MLPSGHLGLFFDEQWHPTNDHFSAGHDIECSWLMNEAADVLGIDCTPTVLRLAEAAKEGIHPDGSIGEKTWWEQAEAVVGFLNLWQITNDQSAMELALKTYSYIQDVLIDRTYGEWFWAVLPDGTPDRTQDKAGFWKCPYHNSRMCFEIIERCAKRTKTATLKE
jgi:mannobiose 2-epimerase